jgi:hypothetical protein
VHLTSRNAEATDSSLQIFKTGPGKALKGVGCLQYAASLSVLASGSGFSFPAADSYFMRRISWSSDQPKYPGSESQRQQPTKAKQ